MKLLNSARIFCVPLRNRPISKGFQAQMGLCNDPHLSWRSSENRSSRETAGISCFSSDQKYSSRGRAFLLALYGICASA